jgi:hypothetical protein
MERLVSYHCANPRYRSAMSFHAALFSLVRRKVAIFLIALHAFEVPPMDSCFVSRAVI